ncbi:MAG: hypothetical protein LUC90_09260 [Lachnospiraceae bacterium]|nr:hypothetical protein [Lachnospiraceae bacterium]
MFEEELQDLNATYMNLTGRAESELFRILPNYKWDEREIYPETAMYLKALTKTVHAMIRLIDALPDNTLETDKYEMLKKNIELLLPYTEPCIGANVALEKCRLILEEYNENHGRNREYQDWVDALRGCREDFNKEFMKIRHLAKQNDCM